MSSVFINEGTTTIMFRFDCLFRILDFSDRKFSILNFLLSQIHVCQQTYQGYAGRSMTDRRKISLLPIVRVKTTVKKVSDIFCISKYKKKLPFVLWTLYLTFFFMLIYFTELFPKCTTHIRKFNFKRLFINQNIFLCIY